MRRRNRRCLEYPFNEIYYKPRGIPLNTLDTVVVTDEELEALRLRYIEKLSQETAAKKMGISQSQYQRDLSLALEKITKALVEGQAINIARVN